MLCKQCKKHEATVSYVEITNGKKFECHLCAVCYAELKEQMRKKTHGEVWPGFIPSRVKRAKFCPVCGTTYADYEKSGLLGCTSCYDVFKEELLPYIRRVHGKVNHIGKMYGNTDEHGMYRRLNRLQEQLEEALAEKRYKDAGRLNNEIQKIKKSIDEGDGKNG